MNHRLNNNKNNHLMTATASTTTTFAPSGAAYASNKPDNVASKNSDREACTALRANYTLPSLFSARLLLTIGISGYFGRAPSAWSFQFTIQQK